MISLKSPREIRAMEKSGAVLAGMHLGIQKIIRPGISSWVIEEFARDYFKQAGAIAAQIGFEGYKYATCVSVNDEICHGFPRKKLILKDGDLVKVDTVVNLDGAFSDSCWSYAVGTPSPEIAKLMDVTKKSLYMGIDQCVPGNRIGDIGAVIQHYTEDENGYGDVKEFVGHGIGPTMHEDPMVPHYGEAGHGLRLRKGMTITVEPMINAGTWQADTSDPSGWLAKTADGGWSCQYEHTLVITEDGPKILTSQDPEADAKYLYDDEYAKELAHYGEIARQVAKKYEE
ncbi:type I methionyl aminopeptidase [Limosilactobacillus fermentum]|uniref:type I methionyl aminopeptidase n=1 Tax=Limosilactobacillus fermentum TaxID=1613 RepID=UPI00062DA50E|nr:type I methionyl aminopeptidase [Limosilactobacillus fermentum]KLD54430.1 methionine aminopeptidase [Limosilactobacillus fermentum]MCT3429733.1 type I methionyl aminopeptidase [Limosilactobacillus fermentum]MCT3441246.1 type I methionyl aminopeptidase [Limosilactobacillus fermentum]MDC6079454.1 type I methionyl aminopeptidase [Limosilactobacillus fermentum]WPP06993.1 type I methionyl aminopeptidase [Limosilactobacillus fermentum]